MLLRSAYKSLPPVFRRSIHNWRLAIAGRRIITVEGGYAAGLKMYAYRSDMYQRGDNEMPVQRALAAHVKEGMTVYDIGANVGFFSLLCATMVGDAGRVFAFEPVAENVSALRRNIVLNGIGNVRVLAFAVGRAAGRSQLILSQHPGGATLASGDLVPRDAVGTITVDTVSIDELVRDGRIPPPDLVKLDVEGAERDAIAGMEIALVQHRPVLIYELDDTDPERFARRCAEIDSNVQGLGYALCHLERSYIASDSIVRHTVATPVPLASIH
jgi:FkbM family methyltransferase